MMMYECLYELANYEMSIGMYERKLVLFLELRSFTSSLEIADFYFCYCSALPLQSDIASLKSHFAVYLFWKSPIASSEDTNTPVDLSLSIQF